MSELALTGERRRPLAGLVRVTFVVSSLATLVLARTGVSVVVLVVGLALCFLALYGLDRSEQRFQLWAGYVLGFVIFAHLRTLGDETGIPIRGRYALDAEKWLFGGAIPTQWLQRHLYQPNQIGALEIGCTAVYMSYFVVPQVVALVLWRRDVQAFRRYGLAVLVAVYTGLAVCFLAPTAPPWLASQYAGGPDLARVIAAVIGWSPEHADGGSGPAGQNPFAAMPSLHIALTTLIVVALWRRRALRAPALLYLAAMAFTLVYTGEHYVVDELAGIATAAFAWLVATMLVRSRADENAEAPRLPVVGHEPA
jgi:PAP2 superfamily